MNFLLTVSINELYHMNYNNELIKSLICLDYTMSGKGIDNEGFISSDYYG